MNKSKRNMISLVFGVVLILIGAMLDNLGIGMKDYVMLGSVGKYMMFVGLLALLITLINSFKKKERIVDERMHQIAYKASRATFIALFLIAFIVMIYDGIKTMTVPYYIFMGNLVSILLLVYFISYKIIERRM